MRANGIYPIARIVVAKDPLLASPSASGRSQCGARPTASRGSTGRANPGSIRISARVWAYAGDLATEAVRLGFSEVQFDYVRFPDEPRLLREAAFRWQRAARATG